MQLISCHRNWSSDELSVHPVAAAQVEPELIKAMRAGGKDGAGAA
jgi:hypothetical protein